jgi:hypothetical protein
MHKIPGGNIMKTLSLALITAAFVLASCSTTKQAASAEYDDVYYNPNQVEKQATNTVAAQPAAVTPQQAMSAQPLYQEPANSQPVAAANENLSDYEIYRMQQEAEMLGESYAPEGSEALYAEQYVEYDTLGEYGQKGAPVIVNNYNYYTDPTDYYYSSSLRRFSDNYYGWNYYDPYYTDMYWYTGSPFSWGISMGFGYPGWGMGFSYGNPYRPYYGYGYGYGGWYDPWYSYGYGGYYGGYWGGYYPYYGGSYWTGYNHGYYNGFYNGYYGNDYRGSAYRYGRLDSRHSYGYTNPTRATAGSSKASMAGDPRYRSRTTTATAKSATATRSNSGVATAAQRQGTNATGNAVQRQVRTTTNSAAQRTTTGAVKTTRTVPSANVPQRGTSATNQRGTYTPSYSKPRTSSATGYNKSATTTRSYSQPSTPNRTTVTPSAVTPSRSSTSFSRPSSAPSSSYSRPSTSTRSSSSYSRPSSSSVSRSSGGSVSRSSGSSYSGGSVSRSSGGSSSGGSRSSAGSSSGGSRSSGGSSSSSRR